MMDRKFTSWAFVLLIATVGHTFGQKMQRIAKANAKFENYDYIDAQNVYLKVVESGYQSQEIFQRLGDTYYYNGNYNLAAKWYGKLLNSYPGDYEVEFYYRAAQSMKSAEKFDVAERLMNQFLSMGGELPKEDVFYDDPDFLKELGLQPSKYVIESVETNSKYSDFGPAFFQDKLVFSASSKDIDHFSNHNWNNLPYLDLFIADMDENGTLSNARELPGEINTDYHDASPAFTKDGRTMYFTRNNHLGGKTGRDHKNTVKLKLYVASSSDGEHWGNVRELPFNSDHYSTSHPSLSNDGKRLYFASDMPGTIGNSDLWYVDILGPNRFGEPVNLGPKINTRGKETFPFISENNNLYFSSKRRGGKGGLDVYIATFDEEGEVDAITNFGAPVNTNQDDFAFIIKESEKMGFYTSNARGGRGSIDDEIYRFKEVCVMTVRGKILDMDTQELLEGAEVTLMGEDDMPIETLHTQEDGKYIFTVSCGTKYKLKASSNDYYSLEVKIKTPEIGGLMEVDLELKYKNPCPPNDLGCRLSLQPIYFDYDKDFIRPDAEIELAKILAAMKVYPELVIHIESHTDSRGNDDYNQKLSLRRANSTELWLNSKGIAAERLSSMGYGESQLQNRCEDDVECTEEEHQLNRRSMFMIVQSIVELAN